MTLAEQAVRRVELARQINRPPVRWIATAEAAKQLSDESGQLAGLPIEIGHPRSEWGLDLICATA